VKQKSAFNITYDQNGSAHGLMFVVAILIIVFAGIGMLHSKSGSVSADSPEIKSGLNNQCLDDRHSNDKPGAEVDDYSCNNTDAQNWKFTNSAIINRNGLCLSVENDATTENSPVVLNTCDQSPGQVWLADNGGLYNPNSTLCLSEPSEGSGKQVVLGSCSNVKETNEQWSSDDLDLNCGDNTVMGDKISCYAEKEWNTWESGNPSHESLLNSYTDGAPYEEWCADFVSYVYKEAGYQFNNGEAGQGYWDESNANLVQNENFTIHYASSGYIPKTGDVAYFNYTGGHVEIVVSGGKHPSFVYGNSATIDPTTGNGQMESNTITSKVGQGHLVYYLSPN
jgi:hypothetical protein